MKIKKTEQSSEGKLGELRARLPGVPELQIDERGKLTAQVTAWVPDNQGNAEQLQVILTDGDIERLLASLANPKTPEHATVVGKLMGENLRSLLRLSALGAGTTISD
ncbi:hypothetical protein LKR43_03280 [Pusillimonas sp. MFBS29]|uniref:hypothetical protein n=1 Tax=Pusillimonas sp. MFBS29 TaxID=2886690 RepID=UPI001D129E90|nr:hypothetical protein [Pusillimonas sp. MFBS29]MCC2595356.1 hypothetical protein [Pusillimonas sp. MFBS29]